MRILPALTNAVRSSHITATGSLFLDLTHSEAAGTELCGFIQGRYTARSMGFQLTVLEVRAIHDLLERFEFNALAKPDEYIEFVTAPQVLCMQLRYQGEPGLVIASIDLSRKDGDREIAKLELSALETKRFKEVIGRARQITLAAAA